MISYLINKFGLHQTTTSFSHFFIHVGQKFLHNFNINENITLPGKTKSLQKGIGIFTSVIR